MSEQNTTVASLLRMISRRWEPVAMVQAPLPDKGRSNHRGITSWQAPAGLEVERGDVLALDDSRWLLLADDTPAGQRVWTVRSLGALPTA